MRLINALVLFVTLVACTPINDIRHKTLLTSDNATIVTGVSWRNTEGNVPIRREIRDLKENYPEQWTLYIMGLSIHGKPYKIWGGVQGVPGKSPSGYCPHVNPLFFSWHRPYLALYEQELYQHVRAAAMTFPSEIHDKFKEAANSFRIPYWDWALGEDGGDVPEFLLSPSVEITGADGVPRNVTNPLHHYEFHPLVSGDFDGKWAKQNTTVRWADSDSSGAKSQDELFQKSFKSLRRGLADSVAKGFRVATSLNGFSMSHIEPVHGSIHYAIGGQKSGNKAPYDGHMWPVEYSAFEPLFMLHHCNVDRLYALYQALHPNQTFENATIGRNGNFVLENHAWVHGDTELKPFWDTRTSFWTPNKARHTTALGYAYPETQPWAFESEGEYKVSVEESVERLYGGSERGRLGVGRGLRGVVVDGEGGFEEWSLEVRAVQARLPATFVVRFGLKGVGDSEVEVGSWSVLMPMDHHFADGDEGGTDEKPITGTVGLTAALLDRVEAGELESLHDNVVVPYLRDRLTWSVVDGHGSTLADDDLHGLVIETVSTHVRIPHDPKKGLMYGGEIVKHPDVTAGKAGGSVVS
ncbi:tyrosinase [Aaosphaeria arxii CBS 175.79]|uniref:tyrosinase n=1 Tax=Aaosphaeria arxii CBS 175.79 TaxID=1450172 RepID=A0A6A5Y2W9_9PLEO|nr:tyrosinase [Aaosphaeria arxii CBS 175.79]KAF2019892.1 tyrosinase [Aaosphaeria arxii CBS 175.79]